MAGSDNHIEPLRLFDLARHKTRGLQPTEVELQHLRTCEECQQVLEVFTRQFSKQSHNKPEDAA
jgi:hypothetical protein